MTCIPPPAADSTPASGSTRGFGLTRAGSFCVRLSIPVNHTEHRSGFPAFTLRQLPLNASTHASTGAAAKPSTPPLTHHVHLHPGFEFFVVPHHTATHPVPPQPWQSSNVQDPGTGRFITP